MRRHLSPLRIVVLLGAAFLGVALLALSPSGSTQASLRAGNPRATESTTMTRTSSEPSKRPTLSHLEAADRVIHASPLQTVRLSWDRVAPDSVLESAGSTFDLLIENLSDSDVEVSIQVMIDAGTGMASLRDLGLQAVGPNRSARVSLRPEALGLDLDSMQFSGRLHATATAQHGSERTTETSPSLFFHRPPGNRSGLLVYGEDVLRERFRAGDFRDLLDIPPEDGAVIDRVVASIASDSDPALGAHGTGVPSARPTEPLAD